jgi:hypothetical protein
MKQAFVLIVFLFFNSSCQNNSTTSVETEKLKLDSNSHNGIKQADPSLSNNDTFNRDEELQSVVLDTGVIGFYLGVFQDFSKDSIVIKNPVFTNAYHKGDEDVCFLNRDRTEVLTMIIHPGSTKGVFDEFEITYAKDHKSLENMIMTDHKSFITSLQIQLGNSIEKINSILPNEYCVKSGNKVSTFHIQYTIDGKNKYAYLKRHNMPVYFGSFDFINGNLRKYHFGFEYP